MLGAISHALESNRHEFKFQLNHHLILGKCLTFLSLSFLIGKMETLVSSLLGVDFLFQTALLPFISVTSAPTPTPHVEVLRVYIVDSVFFGFSLKFPVNCLWCMFSGSQMITALWCSNVFQMGHAHMVASVPGQLFST